MKELFASASFAGAALTMVAFFAGSAIKDKFKSQIFNPILIAIVVIITFLLATGIDYDTYNAGAKYISWFLTPATVSLAIPLYRQIEQLKNNVFAILMGIFSGVVASAVGILTLAVIFGLSHPEYVTLLPKSITSAIGMGVADELGGFSTITVPVIIITGIFGNITASAVLNFFKITNPVAKGLAIGTASHGTGTARAIELGEVEGAMSGLSIAVAGLMTVVVAQVFALLH